MGAYLRRAPFALALRAGLRFFAGAARRTFLRGATTGAAFLVCDEGNSPRSIEAPVAIQLA